MNRRDFLKGTGLALGGVTAAGRLARGAPFKTRHLIWIVNGNGARKMDWYNNRHLSPNLARMAEKAFVYTNSHNDTVSSHGLAWAELMTGRPHDGRAALYPTPLQSVRSAHGDAASNYWLMDGVSHFRQWRRQPVSSSFSLTASHVFQPLMRGSPPTPAQVVAREFSDMGLTNSEKSRLEQFVDAAAKMKLWEFNLRHAPIPRDPFVGDSLGFALIPHVLKEFKPRMLAFHQVGHDVAHGNGAFWQGQNAFLEYEKVCRTTDEQIGRIFDFVRNDPYFSTNTTIVIRPDFGRDDEANEYGELGHSSEFEQTRVSAEIWYGPDFEPGISHRLTNRIDVAPTIARLLDVAIPNAPGSVHTELFT